MKKVALYARTGTEQEAVVYARYSTDLQKDRSIDDQVTLCKQLAERHGYKVTEVFSDRAKSGASMFERDGLLALMNAAKKKGAFFAVVTESLSRLSRDMEDTAAIYKRLKFHGVKIIDCNGEATDIHVGVGGIVNSMFLKNLAVSVTRGRNARVREGLIPGKPAYGYRMVPGQPGVREIDPETSKIVLRMFQEYADGHSTRDICERLIKEGVPSPTGGLWNHQKLISGGFKGHGGLFGNQLYIGKLVWNVATQMKNPLNGKRVNRKSDEEPIETNVPHLRIVPQKLWDCVEAMRKTRRRGRLEPGPRVSRVTDRDRLMLGLVKCGKCGTAMRIAQANMDGTPRVTCSHGHRRMGCNHTKSYSLRELDRLALLDVKKKLTDPAALTAMARGYQERYADRQKTFRGEHASAQKDFNHVSVQIDRIVNAISLIEDEPVEALVEKLKEFRLKKAALQHKLDLIEAQSNVVTLHPASIEKFSRDVKRIYVALTREDDPDGEELAPFHHAFHNIVHAIMVHPTPKRADYNAETIIRVSAINGFEIDHKLPSIEELLAEQGVNSSKFSSLTGSYGGHNLNSEGLISLGQWQRQAA
jgi:DNA invertase Pin-like site-specific DNA recombinase